MLSSLTFGFCSIWSLHFVAMLACELDLPVGIDVSLTVLSSVLAVAFTFAALAFDLLCEEYCLRQRLRSCSSWIQRAPNSDTSRPASNNWHNRAKRLPGSMDEEYADYGNHDHDQERFSLLRGYTFDSDNYASSSTECEGGCAPDSVHPAIDDDPKRKSSGSPSTFSPSETADPSSNFSESQRSLFQDSTHSSHGLSNIVNIAQQNTTPGRNAFIVTGEALHAGFTTRNIIKGFLWSLAITGMHYVGIAALRIPSGHLTLDPWLVILSGLISWIVCLIGAILMAQIEAHLAQQVLFSVVASTGVAAMHFIGKPIDYSMEVSINIGAQV